MGLGEYNVQKDNATLCFIVYLTSNVQKDNSTLCL